MDIEITVEELEAEALAVGTDELLLPDAVPLIGSYAASSPHLPAWYMPVVANTESSPWRTAIVYLLMVAFVVINALGLCITYGRLELA